MNGILDTHVLLWWYMDSPKLPSKYRDFLLGVEKKNEELGVSVISLWEIATLVALKKLEVSVALDSWFAELESDEIVRILPLNGKIILESKLLGPEFPKDPADQLIAATARHYSLPLLTLDERIKKSRVVLVA
jgi:PIN domain nuclease of toxin-antitoxin system